ncbi:MAG: helix-turn-helix domain-containing protein [Actinobacteria bacterium]|nr:helix-turn-helix domain-containing protein [Actinomycetota bacterium]MCG2820255.1 helix-turn-helix domain-containing protein [Actinomycetes bacterium]MBU4219561.1 helix-turn-helix domain-containing protein [Actinomycetota bacterium]MBU4358129.1 helix-turn-helix domain-containing protein [Actinomycetota bacterium]MBU4392351.1 helix-turn-helix domain-containing protein [Actinomycetota bacterium]
MNEFGNLIKAERERREWSLRELADKSGVSTGAISQIERGKRRSPHEKTMKRLVKALELDVGEQEREMDDISTPALSSPMQELYNALWKLGLSRVAIDNILQITRLWLESERRR